MHIAVIAEYNPFHNGHEFQLRTLRETFGEDTVITAILGGVFSQRGEPYIAPPYVRAEAAAKCGADLVLELPFPYSCAPARVFARAGVEIAEKIGADILAFGSECGDIDTLGKMLERLDSDEFKAALDARANESSATSKTRLYSEVYASLYGSAQADKPNDILAIEYMRAIKNLGAKIKPYTILRRGDYKSGEGEYASASSLRREYRERGIAAFEGNIPDEAFEVFSKAQKNGLLFPDFEKLSSAVLLKLANGSGDVAFSGGGLLERLKNAAKNAKSISEAAAKTATKRYTDAEISRCILYSLLGVTSSDMDSPVLYTRLLSLSDHGRKILAKKLDIEILTKPSATEKLSWAARAQYEKTFAAERAYALCLDGGYEHITQSPRIVSKM